MKGHSETYIPTIKDMKVLFFGLNNLWKPWMSGNSPTGILNQHPHKKNQGDNDEELCDDFNDDSNPSILSKEITLAALSSSE